MNEWTVGAFLFIVLTAVVFGVWFPLKTAKRFDEDTDNEAEE